MKKLIDRFAGSFQLLFVVCIVGGAILFSFAMGSGKPVTYPAPADEFLTVSVINPVEETYQPHIQINGVVEARTIAEVIPQVGGRVVSVSQAFRPGSRIAKGEILFEIDASDYELAVERTLAEIEAARSELALLEAQATAEKEIWRQQDTGKKIPDLIARVPQIAAANARIHSAEAARDTALLALRRTVVRSPFDARILETQLAVGQVVSTASMVGRIFSVDSLEIAAPVSQQELAMLGDVLGRSAAIARESSNATTLDGAVVRQAAALNEQTRLSTLYIATSNADSLTLGEFVNVEILGQDAPNTLRLPAASLTSRDEVWVVNNGQLESRKVNVLGNYSETAVVAAFDTAEGIVAIPPADVRAGLSVSAKGLHSLASTGIGSAGAK